MHASYMIKGFSGLQTGYMEGFSGLLHEDGTWVLEAVAMATSISVFEKEHSLTQTTNSKHKCPGNHSREQWLAHRTCW